MPCYFDVNTTELAKILVDNKLYEMIDKYIDGTILNETNFIENTKENSELVRLYSAGEGFWSDDFWDEYAKIKILEKEEICEAWDQYEQYCTTDSIIERQHHIVSHAIDVLDFDVLALFEKNIDINYIADGNDYTYLHLAIANIVGERYEYDNFDNPDDFDTRSNYDTRMFDYLYNLAKEKKQYTEDTKRDVSFRARAIVKTKNLELIDHFCKLDISLEEIYDSAIRGNLQFVKTFLETNYKL